MNRRLIEYKAEYGKICCPKGFLDELKGLDIEDQIKRYRWVWAEVSPEDYPLYLKRLDGYVRIPNESTVIVKDGIVVGFYRYTSEQYEKEHYVLPYQSIDYYGSDNNGAGYKERSAKHTLICW